jgi:hypothetical protein
MELFGGKDVYPATEYLTDVRNTVWRELDGTGRVKVDPLRQSLQWEHIQDLGSNVQRNIGYLYQAELKALDASIKAALPRAADKATRAHLETARVKIAAALDVKSRSGAQAFQPPMPQAPSGSDPDGSEWRPTKTTNGCPGEFMAR